MPGSVSSNHLQWPHCRPEKEGEDVFPVLELKFPHSLWRERPHKRRYFPEACEEDHGRARIHKAAGGGHYTRADVYVEEWPLESLHRSRFFLKGCSLWRTHTGAAEQSEEEGATGRGCDGLTVTLIPQP